MRALFAFIFGGSAAFAAIATTAMGSGGFSLTGAQRNYQLRVRANSHSDARWLESERTNDVDTWLFRRLSLNVEGAVGAAYAFRFMPDFALSKTNILEAYAAYRPSTAFNLLVGKTKAPFDLERLVSQTDLVFIERAWPSSLSPNRDVGLQVFGEVSSTIGYQLGWLRGVRDNDSATTVGFPPRELVARVLVQPFKNHAGSRFRGFGFGLAASRGDKGMVRPNGYRTHAQQRFFAWRSGVVNDGAHTRLEPQAYLYRGPFGFLGSWVISRQALAIADRSAAHNLATKAWFVAAHGVLTGENASYRGVTPAKPFRWPGEAWGAFEVAGRIDGFAGDDRAFPLFADATTSARRARGVTLGMNWYLNAAVKASVNFEHTSFAGGERGPATRTDEHAVLARLQVRY
jgi:phosphate-selective porin OprO and OprP